MSLFDLALLASALIVAVAMYAGARRPDRRRRTFAVAGLIVAGSWVAVWLLARGMCCY